MSLLRYSFQLLRVPVGRVPSMAAARADCSVSSAAGTAAAPSSDDVRAQRLERLETAETPSSVGPVDAPSFDMENPFQPERRLCIACQRGLQFDYKNFRLISQFTSTFTGRLFSRHVTGLCKTQHAKLKLEHQKAVMCGYLTEQMKSVEFRHDPKLCDVAHPVRPHKYA